MREGWREMPRRNAKQLSWYRQRLVCYVAPGVRDTIAAMAKDDGVTISEFVGSMLEKWIVSLDDLFPGEGEDTRCLDPHVHYELKRNLLQGTRRQANYAHSRLPSKAKRAEFPARGIDDDIEDPTEDRAETGG